MVLLSDEFHAISSTPACHVAPSLCCVHLIYSLLIEKDISDRQNIPVKPTCVYVCLSSGTLFILLIRVSTFFPIFLLSVLQYFPFHVVAIIILIVFIMSFCKNTKCLTFVFSGEIHRILYRSWNYKQGPQEI